MRDARFRILTTMLLSVSSFLSTWGALATLAWWLAFTPRLKTVPHPKALLGAVVMIAVTALVSELTGGQGLSYILRMVPILLVAAWAFSEWEENEMLDVSVWLMGKDLGFDIGLMAEMGLQSISRINEDFIRVRQAMAIKGMKFSVGNIIPLASNMVISQLQRTDDAAKLLRVRGYRKGGDIEPKFEKDSTDIVLLSLSFVVLLVGLLGYQ